MSDTSIGLVGPGDLAGVADLPLVEDWLERGLDMTMLWK